MSILCRCGRGLSRNTQSTSNWCSLRGDQWSYSFPFKVDATLCLQDRWSCCFPSKVDMLCLQPRSRHNSLLGKGWPSHFCCIPSYIPIKLKVHMRATSDRLKSSRSGPQRWIPNPTRCLPCATFHMPGTEDPTSKSYRLVCHRHWVNLCQTPPALLRFLLRRLAVNTPVSTTSVHIQQIET